MLEQLVGKNGEIVGSSKYFAKINENTFLGRLVKEESEVDYYHAVEELPVVDVIGELTVDLENKANLICYIPQKNKDRLIEFLQKLTELKSDTYAGYCIGILEKKVDYQYIYKLDAKIQRIKKGGTFGMTEADGIQFFRDIIAEGGIRSVTDMGSRFYLSDIFEYEDESIIEHVITRYDLLNGGVNYRGACGFGIGSEPYLDYLEKKVLGEAGQKYLKDSGKTGGYKAAIDESRDEIGNILYDDLKLGESKQDYISMVDSAMLISAVSELSKLRFECATEIIKLIDSLTGGAGGRNPYSHMGIYDEDFEAYIQCKITEDDLLVIAQAFALYNAAGEMYYYKNEAHYMAAHIRMKYDPNYRKNDTFDYTHGGKFDPNKSEEPPREPRFIQPESLLTAEHTNLIKFTEKLKAIKGTEEWNTLKAGVWFATSTEATRFKKIEPFKDQWIEGYKEIIKSASKRYNIPEVLLARVIHNEVGGDPLWWDEAKYLAAGMMGKQKETVSFGNPSVQLLTAAEMLGYDFNNLTERQKNAIKASIVDPVQGVFISAKYISWLKNVDFPNKNIEDLTDDDIRVIYARYNQGPGKALDSLYLEPSDAMTEKITKLKKILDIN